MRIGLFYSIYAFQCILNVLLECIELFNTVECILYMRIFLLESIDLILAHHASTAGIICPHIMFLLCQHIWQRPTCCHVLSFAPLCVLLHSNETEGTALASAAHVGKDRIVAYLLSVGASANGSVERRKMKVAIHN